MENSNGQMPGSERQAGELQNPDGVAKQPDRSTFDPSRPSVIFIELDGDKFHIDWDNFQAPSTILFALQKATEAAVHHIRTLVNERPMPPRPGWVKNR